MQANLETLRTRIGQVADLRDVSGLREGQRSLIARISEVEECVSAQNMREFVRRIILIETRLGNCCGVIGEAIRNCIMRLDRHKADLDDLRARMRTQDWYRDLSEQKSDEEMQRMLARAEGQGVNAENQSGIENRSNCRHRRSPKNHAPQGRIPRTMNEGAPLGPQPQGAVNLPAVNEDPTQHRLQHVAATQQQCANQMTSLEARVEQLKFEFRKAMVDSTLALQTVVAEVRGQGQGMERIHHTLYNVAMEKLDERNARFQRHDDVMQQVLTKTDKQRHDVCTSLGRFIEEQGDSRTFVEELARRIDAIKDGTHPAELRQNRPLKVKRGPLMLALPCN